jgi:hypothetical protein
MRNRKEDRVADPWASVVSNYTRREQAGTPSRATNCPTFRVDHDLCEFTTFSLMISLSRFENAFSEGLSTYGCSSLSLLLPAALEAVLHSLSTLAVRYTSIVERKIHCVESS